MTATSPPNPRDLLPGGIFSTRRLVRRFGGVAGVATAASLWLLGLVVSWISSGMVGGALSFVLTVMALPVMPLAGMPVSGGGGRMLAVVAASAVSWWIVGQMVAARVARKPVVGWGDWARGFVVMGSGLWMGAVGAMMIAAVAVAVV